MNSAAKLINCRAILFCLPDTLTSVAHDEVDSSGRRHTSVPLTSLQTSFIDVIHMLTISEGKVA